MAHRKVPPVAPQCPLDHQKSPRGAAEASNLREFPRPTTSHFKIPRVTLKDLRSSKEKPQWLKQRYDSSLRALERAKREWEQTLESVVEGLRMVFDPGATQGTYKRAAKFRATTSSTPNKSETQA